MSDFMATNMRLMYEHGSGLFRRKRDYLLSKKKINNYISMKIRYDKHET